MPIIEIEKPLQPQNEPKEIPKPMSAELLSKSKQTAPDANFIAEVWKQRT